jgi:hypothetical protein
VRGVAHKIILHLPPDNILPPVNTPGAMKNREAVNQPIRDDLASNLIGWLAGLQSGGRIWPGNWFQRAAEMLRFQRAAEMLRVDLGNAGIPDCTADGTLDFLALRVTFITELARNEIRPKSRPNSCTS